MRTTPQLTEFLSPPPALGEKLIITLQIAFPLCSFPSPQLRLWTCDKHSARRNPPSLVLFLRKSHLETSPLTSREISSKVARKAPIPRGSVLGGPQGPRSPVLGRFGEGCSRSAVYAPAPSWKAWPERVFVHVCGGPVQRLALSNRGIQRPKNLQTLAF